MRFLSPTRWLPRRYSASGLRRTKRRNARKLKSTPLNQRWELKEQLDADCREWLYPLRAIDDHRLIARAAKMDIDLDDIPLPPPFLADDRPSHFDTDPFGDRYLRDETRRALQATMRARGPSYRKKRRERSELIVKATGLIGTGIGLVSALSWLLH
jgi:hypothetical protein